MNKTNIGIALVALIIGLGAGYTFGSARNGTQRAVRFGTGSAQFQQGTQRGNTLRAQGAIVGEILEKDSATLTVSTSGAGSKIIITNASTTASRPMPISDLAKGTVVTVFGIPNQDGSITAQRIQIGSSSRMF